MMCSRNLVWTTTVFFFFIICCRRAPSVRRRTAVIVVLMPRMALHLHIYKVTFRAHRALECWDPNPTSSILETSGMKLLSYKLIRNLVPLLKSRWNSVYFEIRTTHVNGKFCYGPSIFTMVLHHSSLDLWLSHMSSVRRYNQAAAAQVLI